MAANHRLHPKSLNLNSARKRTQSELMSLGIRLYLTGMTISNTVPIIEIFGVDRAQSTVHNWVHKANLQPESGRCPDHIRLTRL